MLSTIGTVLFNDASGTAESSSPEFTTHPIDYTSLEPAGGGIKYAAATAGPTAPNYEDLLGMCQEEIDLHLHICGLTTGDEQSLPS